MASFYAALCTVNIARLIAPIFSLLIGNLVVVVEIRINNDLKTLKNSSRYWKMIQTTKSKSFSLFFSQFFCAHLFIFKFHHHKYFHASFYNLIYFLLFCITSHQFHLSLGFSLLIQFASFPCLLITPNSSPSQSPVRLRKSLSGSSLSRLVIRMWLRADDVSQS